MNLMEITKGYEPKQKPFRDSSAWRCNQRVSTCEFDFVICIYQCNGITRSFISTRFISLAPAKAAKNTSPIGDKLIVTVIK